MRKSETINRCSPSFSLEASVTDVAPGLAAARERRGGRPALWGLLHELGHNHQPVDSGFNWQAVTEVTVNLFTLWTMQAHVGRPLVDGFARWKKEAPAATAAILDRCSGGGISCAA